MNNGKFHLILCILVTFTLPALASSGPAPQNVAIVIYDGVEVLDFAGPAEVLEIAGSYSRVDGTPSLHLYTVAPGASPVTSQNFLKVVPDFTPANAPRPDVLVIPGGQTRALLEDDAFMKWVTTTMNDAITLTVCSGASVPAKTGHLDGKTVTTWFGLVDSLDRRYPNVNVEHGRRFVDNDRIITTAGVSAGIDGALHLVARLRGMEIARRTAQYMEYAWTPEPYLIASYPVLDPHSTESGRSLQIVDMQLASGDATAAVRTLREVVATNPENPDAWDRLGAALMKSEQWNEAVEAYLHLADTPGMSARGIYSAACAAARGGDTDRAISLLTRSVEAGFTNKSWIEQDSDLDSLRSLPGYRALLSRM